MLVYEACSSFPFHVFLDLIRSYLCPSVLNPRVDMRFQIPGLSSAAMTAKSAGGHEKEVNSYNDTRSSNDMEALGEKGYDDRAATADANVIDTSDDESIEKIDTNAQAGVQKAQAMTQVWSRNEIILAYAM